MTTRSKPKPSTNENQNPPQQEQQISQPAPIGRPPPSKQENIINEIERGKRNLLKVSINQVKPSNTLRNYWNPLDPTMT